MLAKIITSKSYNNEFLKIIDIDILYKKRYKDIVFIVLYNEKEYELLTSHYVGIYYSEYESVNKEMNKDSINKLFEYWVSKHSVLEFSLSSRVGIDDTIAYRENYFWRSS